MYQLSPAQLFDCSIPSFKLQNFSQIYSIRDDRITGCPPLPPIVLALREDGQAIKSNFLHVLAENFASLSGLWRCTIDLIASIVSKPREERLERGLRVPRFSPLNDLADNLPINSASL